MTNRFLTLLALLTVAACVSACGASSRAGTDATKLAQAPAVERGENATLLEFIAAANAPRADWYLPEELESGETRTASDGLVTLQGDGRRYRVYFGGLTPQTTGTVEYRNADPELVVKAGYGMAWGWRPFITTDRITTATDGTTVLVQIEGNVHRVILISSGTVRVETRPGDDECSPQQSVTFLKEPWTYVECTQTDDDGDNRPCYQLTGSPMEIGRGSLRKFIENVLKQHRLKQLM